MKSQTPSSAKGLPAQAGFTLIEILLVIGLVVMVASIGLFFDFDNLRSGTFYADRDMLISALQHARAEAVSNICRGGCDSGKPHGVKILTNSFVIFQGDTYDPSSPYNAVLNANPNIAHPSPDDEVVFEQLSGDVASDVQIILESIELGRKTTIDINTEGQIIWTDERI